MPYSPQHKSQTRAKIVESARQLFNRHGFDGVTIDMVMELAGRTRGGFYGHFSNKEELFAASVESFLMGRGARWRGEAGIDPFRASREDAANMVTSYLSDQHLGDIEGQCPMIALPSDIGRCGSEVRAAYQQLLEAMVGLFEKSADAHDPDTRHRALTLAALCVGGMVLARTLPDSALAKDVREASRRYAETLIR